jgi:glycosyltransferase involved in cell wall biosynthesis
MRVLMVSHYFPPHVGGIENVARQQAIELTRLGVQVTVLTSGTPAPGDGDDGFAVVRVPAWNGLENRSGVPFPVFSPRLAAAMWKWVSWADVVHIHDCLYLSSWAAGVAAAVRRKPTVLTQHVALVDHPSPIVTLVQKVVYAVFGRLIMRRATAIAVLNATVERFVRGLGGKRAAITLLPNGVDAGLFHPAADPQERKAIRARLGLPDDAVLVLFVGRPVPKKGYPMLLDAHRTQDGYELVLAGEPPAGGFPVGRKGIHHLGAMAPAALADVYRACDVFALPSTAEGFPLTVQEAMASGLPVVTTDDPGYAPYGLDRSQVALVPREVAALRAVLTELAADAGRRARMGEYSARYAADAFSWPTHARVLRRLYGGAP